MAAFDLPTTSAQNQRVRSVLLKAGMSVTGIQQLMTAQQIASPLDRQAVAKLVDTLLGGGADPVLGPGTIAPEYKPRKPERGI